MLEYVVDFLLGASIKMADEIADVPYLSDRFASYITPIIMISIFLYGLRAVDDFYYNLIWLSWFFSAYFGNSIENDLDKQNWNLIFGMVVFATCYTISYPLPQTSWILLITFLLYTGIGNILENVFLPEEVSIQKILVSLFVCILIPLLYFYGLPFMYLTYPNADIRFAEKHLVLIFGYFFIRFFSKVYLYNSDIS
jgi:hypothetical protein